MYYLNPRQNPSGAYGAPQTNPIPGFLELPDSLLPDFIACNGFATLTTEGDTIAALTPNLEAWEAWKISLPEEPTEPEPTAQEDTDALLVDHEYRLTLLELGVANDAV